MVLDPEGISLSLCAPLRLRVKLRRGDWAMNIASHVVYCAASRDLFEQCAAR